MPNELQRSTTPNTKYVPSANLPQSPVIQMLDCRDREDGRHQYLLISFSNYFTATVGRPSAAFKYHPWCSMENRKEEN